MLRRIGFARGQETARRVPPVGDVDGGGYEVFFVTRRLIVFRVRASWTLFTTDEGMRMLTYSRFPGAPFLYFRTPEQARNR